MKDVEGAVARQYPIQWGKMEPDSTTVQVVRSVCYLACCVVDAVPCRARRITRGGGPTAPVQSSVKGLGELFAKNLKQLINQLFKEAQKESVVAQQTMESLAKDIQKERRVKSDMPHSLPFYE